MEIQWASTCLNGCIHIKPHYTAAYITQVCAHGTKVWLLKTYLSTTDTCFSQSWQRRKTGESFTWLKFSPTNTNHRLKPAACHERTFINLFFLCHEKMQMAQQGQMGHRKCISEDVSALLPNQTVKGEGRKSRIEESKEVRLVLSLVLSQEYSPSKYLGKLCWKE